MPLYYPTAKATYKGKTVHFPYFMKSVHGKDITDECSEQWVMTHSITPFQAYLAEYEAVDIIFSVFILIACLMFLAGVISTLSFLIALI